MDLTEQDADAFDEVYLKEHPMVLLELYAPWCGHCKALAPVYEEAARTLAETFPNVTVAKCDATVNEAMSEKFEVQGYPTLKWIEYVEGGSPRVIDFGFQGQGAAEIVKFVEKRAGDAVTEIPSDLVEGSKAVLAAIEKDGAAVLGYFLSKDSDEFRVYADAARQVDGPAWLYTLDAAQAETLTGTVMDNKLPVPTKPSVVVVRKGSPNAAMPFTAEFDDDTKPLTDFVKIYSMPDVVPFDQENVDMIFSSPIKHQVLLFAKPDQMAAAKEYYEKVAAHHRGEYIFVSVTMDGSDDAMGVADFFGLISADDTPEDDTPESDEERSRKAAEKLEGFKPEVFIFHMPDEENADEDSEESKTPTPGKWKMEQELSYGALLEFMAAHKNGTLEQFYKSAEPPETQEGPVIEVVGKTFNDIVLDPTKDVLLELYAPWCQHCQAFEPQYEKLARRFAPVESMVIAKMDGTTNEHPQANVEGFPTIYFFPAGEGSERLSLADAERTVPALTKWLKKHAKIPYELKKKAQAQSDDTAAKSDDKAHDEL